MKKVLNIDGKEVEIAVNGATLLRYKAEFKRDALQDIFKLISGVENLNDLNKVNEVEFMKNLDLEVFYNLLYIMAKTANPEIKVPIMEWLESFNNLPILELLFPVIELLTDSLKTTDESKKKTNQFHKKKKKKY